jgi:hypothetical protein
MYRTRTQFTKALSKKVGQDGQLQNLADVRKGETIFTEGENINGVFCVKDGVCKMTNSALTDATKSCIWSRKANCWPTVYDQR